MVSGRKSEITEARLTKVYYSCVWTARLGRFGLVRLGSNLRHLVAASQTLSALELYLHFSTEENLASRLLSLIAARSESKCQESSPRSVPDSALPLLSGHLPTFTQSSDTQNGRHSQRRVTFVKLFDN